ALQAARPNVFLLGARGAGRSASVGKWLFPPYTREAGGQGGAFFQKGPTKIAVFTVVNSLGAIVDRQGNVVRGHLNPQTGQRAQASDVLGLSHKPASGNTTLTLVVTNQKVAAHALRQLARHVHSSMARAIYPFHTMEDGDILFAATTNQVDNPDLNDFVLSHLASELAWDAVLACFDKGKVT
ncbi:MAG: peptidase S58, DmpA, partial [Delftia sp.]|nr:peptidase S58, DmpA [Delftia sp.]